MAYTVWLGGTNVDSDDESVIDPDTIPDAVRLYIVDIPDELPHLVVPPSR